MSVLKDKRTTSKAEYVNVANQIYVKTVDFLSRVSPRYSRLIAADTAHLAGQVMDHAEEANKIYPSDQLRKDLRKSHHLEAMAHLSALDVRLSHCYKFCTAIRRALSRTERATRCRPRRPWSDWTI